MKLTQWEILIKNKNFVRFPTLAKLSHADMSTDNQDYYLADRFPKYSMGSYYSDNNV